MFREGSLFERLMRPDPGQRTMQEDTNALMRSILHNLQQILNTRQGSAAAQMELGILTPTEIAYNFPDSITQVQRAIRECIEKYEPRLTAVEVSYIEDSDDPLSLRFQITGKLATSKYQTMMSFDTVVDSAGQINLHS